MVLATSEARPSNSYRSQTLVSSALVLGSKKGWLYRVSSVDTAINNVDAGTGTSRAVISVARRPSGRAREAGESVGRTGLSDGSGDGHCALLLDELDLQRSEEHRLAHFPHNLPGGPKLRTRGFDRNCSTSSSFRVDANAPRLGNSMAASGCTDWMPTVQDMPGFILIMYLLPVAPRGTCRGARTSSRGAAMARGRRLRSTEECILESVVEVFLPKRDKLVEVSVEVDGAIVGGDKAIIDTTKSRSWLGFILVIISTCLCPQTWDRHTILSTVD